MRRAGLHKVYGCENPEVIRSGNHDLTRLMDPVTSEMDRVAKLHEFSWAEGLSGGEISTESKNGMVAEVREALRVCESCPHFQQRPAKVVA